MFSPDGKITLQHIHTPGQQCSRLWKLHQLGRAAWQTQSKKNWLDTHLSNLGNGLDVNTCSCNRRSILISLLLFVKVLLWSQYTCDFISIFFLLTILIWLNTVLTQILTLNSDLCQLPVFSNLYAGIQISPDSYCMWHLIIFFFVWLALSQAPLLGGGEGRKGGWERGYCLAWSCDKWIL